MASQLPPEGEASEEAQPFDQSMSVGGYEGAGGNITVSGGTVTATGNNSAGIGGGNQGVGTSAGGTIQIRGGTVEATGVIGGAGIGSGCGSTVALTDGNITVSGGEVKATGGESGAGIGGGKGRAGTSANGNNTISGGSVTANGGKNGAGGTIQISGGNVTANGGSNGGKGIGGGSIGADGTLALSYMSESVNYMSVYATSYGCDVTIGSGCSFKTVDGSTVIMSGNDIGNAAGKVIVPADSTEEKVSVAYVNAAGRDMGQRACVKVTDQTDNWGESGKTTWYAVTENATIGSGITVTGNVNLILCDGKTLKAEQGNTVTEGNRLTVWAQRTADGETADTKMGVLTWGNGDGVYINGGSFTLQGGTITGGNQNFGGGVNVGGGTFTMTGGTISGCTAIYNGGGVYVNFSGTFNMTGGTITKNTAKNGGGYGGGVYVYGGSFTMTGGTISGNTATNDGGALSFTGLMSDTGYTVFTRVPGDATHAPSEAVSVDVRTTKPAEGMRSPSVQGTTGDTVTITVRHGEQYSIDCGATWITPDESGRVVFDNGKKGDGESYGLSPAQTYEIVARRIGTAVLNPSASGAAARVTTPSRSPSARTNTPMIVATTPGSITV